MSPSSSARPHLEALEERTLLDAGLPVFAPDRLLVHFQPGQAAALPGTELGAATDLVPGLYTVHVGAGTTLEEARAAYLASPNVSSVDLDYQMAPAWVPNDPAFGQQWAFRNTGQDGGKAGADISADDAWGIVTGSRRTVVAVLDTGVDYRHLDLYQNIWINQKEIPASRRANLRDLDGDGLITFYDLNNPVNQGAGKITDVDHNGRIDANDLLAPASQGGWADGVSQDGDTRVDDLVGWNTNANTNKVLDDRGHGTHVAGIIGATGNDGQGVAGLNWKVQIMPVKFFDASGSATVSQYIAALDYAVAKGVKLSNHSLQGAPNIPALRLALSAARDRGHLVVAAAGNTSANTDTVPNYPSAFDLDNIVAVAATDRNDQLASYSNYGRVSVDLAAPGSAILSDNLGGGTILRSGTSMAAPMVTGAMALVWSLRGEWTYRNVIDQVLSTVDPLPQLNGKVATGGRLNVLAAVRVPPRPTTPAPWVPPSGSSGTGGSGGGTAPSEAELAAPVLATGTAGAPRLAEVTVDDRAASLDEFFSAADISAVLLRIERSRGEAD